MEYFLIAKTKVVVSSVGYDEFCLSLRSRAKKTPPLSRIIQRNKIKARIREIFPFYMLYEYMVDEIVESLVATTYPPGAPIVRLGEQLARFFVITAGIAVQEKKHKGGQVLES